MTAPSPTPMSLAEAMEACMDEQGRTLFVGRDDVSGAQNDKPLWGSVALGNALDVRGPFNTWPEAASNALGFAVVERDDAAELVAALHKQVSRHTPGDWRAAPDPLLSCVVTGEGTDLRVVAECGERDVRLLAAAPELLEALENIENDDGHIPRAIWDMRNAALAKARGES